jgi:hypothetical protein
MPSRGEKKAGSMLLPDKPENDSQQNGWRLKKLITAFYSGKFLFVLFRFHRFTGIWLLNPG